MNPIVTFDHVLYTLLDRYFTDEKVDNEMKSKKEEADSK